MKPGKLDLPTIWRGCEWSLIFFYWKDLNGDPFDLTGWTPTAHTRHFDLRALIWDDPEHHAAAGITYMLLPATLTANLRLGVEPWDFIFVTPDGRALPPILSGNVEVKQPTTVPDLNGGTTTTLVLNAVH
jgi:hypothetical protein